MRRMLSRSSLFLAFTAFFCLLSLSGFAQGYRIEVELEGFDNDTLTLAYYFGKSQYLKDTTTLQGGKYVFEGSEELKPGVYLVVMPPDNRFIHLLITEEEQKFSAFFNVNDVVMTARFKGSKDNQIYYDYLRELEFRRSRADELRQKLASDSLVTDAERDELAAIDAEVKKIQENVVARYPASLTAMLINANKEIEIPEYPELSEEDRRQKQYEFYKAHYFDHFDLSDPRAIRTGMMQNKIDFTWKNSTTHSRTARS